MSSTAWRRGVLSTDSSNWRRADHSVGDAWRMTRRTMLPGGLPTGPTRVAEFLQAGVHPRRLRARDVHHLGHGIVALEPSAEPAAGSFGRNSPTPGFSYVNGKRLLRPMQQRHIEVARRCTELLPALDTQMFFSRRTAAELWEIPVPPASHGLIEVGAFHPRRAPRRPEFSGHRAKAGILQRAEVKGLPTPSAADVWCLLAAVLSLDELVIAGDHMLTPPRLFSGGRTTKSLASIDELVAAVERHRGCTGADVRRRALTLLRWPVDSPAETQLRLIIVRSGFSEPVVNCPVRAQSRDLHADLGYPKLRIAIEYEGSYHFEGGVEQRRRDVARQEAMIAAGWRVLRVTALDLRDPSAFLTRLAGAIAEAMVELSAR